MTLAFFNAKEILAIVLPQLASAVYFPMHLLLSASTYRMPVHCATGLIINN